MIKAVENRLSLGELIKLYREKADMTQEKLAEKVNVDKAGLCRVETGKVKRPAWETLQKIISVLNIPEDELLEPYIENVDNVDILFSKLDGLVHKEGVNIHLIEKVSTKILQSPTDESLEVVKELYNKAKGIKCRSVRLTLYKAITGYSKSHGMMPYIAKCLLEIYLIERDDFTKLRSTYESGKANLFFNDFLTSEERGEFYYRLQVHAFYTNQFEESVEMGLKALNETISDTRTLANTIYVLSNGYFFLSNYEESKAYLDRYREFDLPEVNDNVKLNEAELYGATGEHKLAISILEDNLPNCGDFALIHAVNQLIDLYFKTNNLPKIQEILFELEEKLLSIPCVTPFKKAELGRYFKLKGKYFIQIDEIEKGINYCLEAAKRYSMIDLVKKEKECLWIISNIHVTNKETDSFKGMEKFNIYLEKEG
ncbi:helix-turn-helix domain-containing protein [Chengkuizengella marina]|uniref:XRE family transcriptional regulator n=1 Tax=Chengkuizengella marina TaxID=2507566 RepID=A0A6N9Q1M3_9BACL|nr:helix-turn-helix transcriptional regulator [Chengkuizengella marina]NBI28995.1 XRE family transcriptional regulator [Chengkuizengella marina]